MLVFTWKILCLAVDTNNNSQQNNSTSKSCHDELHGTTQLMKSALCKYPTVLLLDIDSLLDFRLIHRLFLSLDIHLTGFLYPGQACANVQE